MKKGEPSAPGAGSEPVDRDKMFDRPELGILRHDDSVHADGRGHRKGVGIGDGELPCDPGCLQDVREGIGGRLDRQRFKVMKKRLSLLHGSVLGRDVVDLSDVDLVHEERVARDLGSTEEGPNPFEPAFLVEEGEQSEGIEQTSFLRGHGLLVAPSVRLW